MGATPQRLAKAASLFRRSGLSPTVISSEAAVSVLTPSTAINSGAASATSRLSCSSSSWISSQRCWYTDRASWGGSPRGSVYPRLSAIERVRPRRSPSPRPRPAL
jgi:hypothetical protein